MTALSMPKLIRSSQQSTLPALNCHSTENDDDDDDDDIMKVNPVEQSHMRMPTRKTFFETSQEYMRPASLLEQIDCAMVGANNNQPKNEAATFSIS